MIRNKQERIINQLYLRISTEELREITIVYIPRYTANRNCAVLYIKREKRQTDFLCPPDWTQKKTLRHKSTRRRRHGYMRAILGIFTRIYIL